MNPQNNPQMIKIIRITQCDTTASRCVYGLADYLDQFSLVECKNKNSVDVAGTTKTLILDHLDEANEPNDILRAALKSNVMNIVIADSREDVFYKKTEIFDHEIHFLIDKKRISWTVENTSFNDDKTMAPSIISQYLSGRQ
jgi:hypothetical protein